MFPVFFDVPSGTSPGTYVLVFIGLVFGLPIFSMVLLYYKDLFMDWFDGLFPPYDARTYTTNNTVYSVPKAKPYVAPSYKIDKWGFAEKDRKEPPKALFFSRMGNEETTVEGPWEEVHLKQVELNAWNNKKRGTGVISTQINTKTPEVDESRAFLEQYDSNVGYRG